MNRNKDGVIIAIIINRHSTIGTEHAIETGTC